MSRIAELVLLIISVSALASVFVTGWWRYREGYERGYQDGRAFQIDREQRARDRELARKTGALPDTRAPWPVYMNPGGEAQRPVSSRPAVTAADIPPVTVPRPARTPDGGAGLARPEEKPPPFGPPQPAPDPGPLTITGPALTDTGELRALTDARIAQIVSGEAAWRAKTGLEA